MNQYSHPIDYLIQCCEQTLIDGKSNLDQFTINNAKDELKKLREETNRWLSCESERCKLQDQYNSLLEIFEKPVAWGKTNIHGDLYDLRVLDNPYTPEEEIVPLYSHRVEFKDFYKNHRNNNDNNS